jgi:hypothetical protein
VLFKKEAAQDPEQQVLKLLRLRESVSGQCVSEALWAQDHESPHVLYLPWIRLTDRASAAATQWDTIQRSLDLKRRQLHAPVRPPYQAMTSSMCSERRRVFLATIA